MRIVGLTFGEPSDIASEALPESDITGLDLDKMKVDELKAYALQFGIEIPKDAKKADIICSIKDNIVNISGGDA